MRVPDRVEPGEAVEIRGVDHQRVAVPMAHRIAEPRRNFLRSWRTPIDRQNLEPRVLLIQKCQVRGRLQNLNGVGRIHGTHVAERQTGTGVVAFFRIIAAHCALPHSVKGSGPMPRSMSGTYGLCQTPFRSGLPQGVLGAGPSGGLYAPRPPARRREERPGAGPRPNRHRPKTRLQRLTRR